MQARVFICTCFLLALLILEIHSSANTPTYVIPLSLNPFAQSPIQLTGVAQYFYNSNPDFYSNVTLTDVSHNTKEELKELVKKKLSVVLIVVASSFVGDTLKKSDLKYLSESKWSYIIPVEELIAASNGSITKLADDLELYKFQELGMKFLEKRYNFNMSDVQSKLGLSRMEFLGASEEQWISIVGIITEEIIKDTSEKLNVSRCYLAELLNKTEQEIVTFTLKEIDEYVYNTSSLESKLPEFKESILAKIFNVTTTDLANLSSFNATMVKTLALEDQVEILTTSLLNKFSLSIDAIAKKYKRSPKDILTPCPCQWKPIQIIIVQEAFEEQAKNISVSNKTLALLIKIPYTNLSKFSFEQMEHLIETKVTKVKEKKNIIERKSIQMLNHMGSDSNIINIKEDAFFIIEAVTNFTKSELSLIYAWEDSDYIFADMFSVLDLVYSCSSQVYNNTLLKLAKINTGEESAGNNTCLTIAALRMIWDRATVHDVESRFGNLLTNVSIESMLVSITGGNLTFINRVLNSSQDALALCANVTLEHISVATSQPTIHLKQMSFQDIIELAIELKANQTFSSNTKMTSTISLITSTSLPSMHTPVASSINRPSSMDTSLEPSKYTYIISTKTMALKASHSMIYQYTSEKEDDKATGITNSTIPHRPENVTTPYNSTNNIMTTRGSNSNNTGPVGSSNILLTKRFILKLLILQSMCLMLVWR